MIDYKTAFDNKESYLAIREQVKELLKKINKDYDNTKEQN